ncbi:GNAT family N-acetyltransferase [Neorhizobium galegae]|uniref:GNAT family N-acetyltransferase n=1 Tax=Neorhizobium galegae TaxID=399 RepID=UPI001278EE28|nr:GNAT family N-acetyltransferase [Neorhizobium galegae]KAA9385718.1 GNAT family N-acetyltransferase [Neorhizobium galegae]MCM2497342.1 GNAT family N-acetyltransferase [Neorhizobium galegae]
MHCHENFDCHFRPALPADFDSLRDLASRCWMEIYEPQVPPESIRRFRNEDGAGDYVREFLPSIQVVTVSGQVIGMISVAHGYITGLYVDGRYRGHLIGTSLLHNARLDGGHLLDVSANNRRAIAFYERRDWQRVSTFDEDVFGTRVKAFTLARAR